MRRTLLALVLALLLATQIVRNSAVKALAADSPDRAAAIWRGHPDTEIALGMTEIGRAARERKPVQGATFAMIDDAALKAPLASEPFLVRGVQAQLAGQVDVATQAFLAAERRDPRSLPAHYFLADAFFHSGEARRGLIEIGALARLAPNGATSVAPYLAAYAKDRSNWPQLRSLFEADPELANAALASMATDVRNSDAAMALVPPQLRNPDTRWAPALLSTLITAGEYQKARAVWVAVSAKPVPPGELIHDAAFTDSRSPAPFNWSLISSTVGLAERQPGGRLHVIFYGQEDGLLARQLLLLAPGKYRMTLAVRGGLDQEHALTWSIRCDRSQSPISALPLNVVAVRSWAFEIPAGCPAQWLELSGVSADLQRQSDVVINRLGLTRDQPHG